MPETEMGISLHEDILRILPDAVVWAKPVQGSDHSIIDFKIFFSNQKADELIGHPLGSLTGLCLLKDEVPSTDEAQSSFQHYLKVFQTNQAEEYFYHSHHSNKAVETLRAKLHDGVLSVSRDRTAQRQAERIVTENAVYINSILESSPNGIYALAAIRNKNNEVEDFIFLQANKMFFLFTGLPAEQVMSKSLLLNFPQVKKNGVFQHICDCILDGETRRQEVFTAESNKYFEYTITRQDQDHAVVTFQDITKQVTTLQAIQHQNTVLDNILKYSPTGITITEAVRNKNKEIIDWKTVLVNDIAQSFTGFTKEVMMSKTMGEIDPALLKSDAVAIVASRTLQTGIPFIEHLYIQPTDRWLEVSVAKMDEQHLLNLFTDITATKKIQLQVAEAAERLKAVFDASQSGMFTFSPVYNEQEEVIDFRFIITNKRFAAYIGQTPLVLQGGLGSQWFPGYLTNGVFDMYKHTCVTGETKRKDVHYHVDGLDLYLDLMSTRVGTDVLVTFNDYTPLKMAQLQLEKNIEELRRSNANLEEFAYAASHDLKEPIRKVRFFADNLQTLLGTRLTEKEANLFERMQVAAQRMAMLIDDLLTYSYVSRGIDMVEDIDLSKQVRTVLNDLELIVQEKKAVITVDDLPKIKGHRHQLEQLFQNLISNALKYSKVNEIPQITITCKTISQDGIDVKLSVQNQGSKYYAIEIKDNGIGFEQKEADRIFNVFQRLHGNHEFSGTGVGLSIARKVAENHKGAIVATSEPEKGAVFTLYLPLD